MEEGRTESVLIKEECVEDDGDPQGEMNTREERAGKPGGAHSSASETPPLDSRTAAEGSGNRRSSSESLSGGQGAADMDSALVILGGVASSVWSEGVSSGTIHTRSGCYEERGLRADLCVPHTQTRQGEGAAVSNLDTPGMKWIPPSDKNSLEAHSQAVSRRCGGENERFLCKYCGKGFRFAAKLRVHHRVHTGEKPYRCTHCGRGFSQSCSLTRHLNVHTGYKPFCCTHCGKGYTNKRSLKKHQAAHRVERFGI